MFRYGQQVTERFTDVDTDETERQVAVQVNGTVRAASNLTEVYRRSQRTAPRRERVQEWSNGSRVRHELVRVGGVTVERPDRLEEARASTDEG